MLGVEIKGLFCFEVLNTGDQAPVEPVTLDCGIVSLSPTLGVELNIFKTSF